MSKAREIRSRHFKSSVGSVLNENYSGGRLADTVFEEDFCYVPKLSLPLSSNALKFLEHKFPPTPAGRGNPPPTSESLYDAYIRAAGQPQMMVHYDREPIYWQGKRRLEGRHSLPEATGADILTLDNYRRGLVPSSIGPASTASSVSSRQSGSRLRPPSLGQGQKVTTPLGPIENNRHRLWTPGSEAAGFKPYSPFSEQNFDYAKKPASYIAPEQPDDVRKTCDVIEAPKYSDALKQMLEPPFGNDGTTPKLHGFPEYPDKVMSEKDVPNYVAWAKIYAYCPLTQVKGQEKPVFVPPRGFTPSSVASERPLSIPRNKRLKQLKADVFKGQGGLGKDQGDEKGQGKGERERVPANTEATTNAQVEKNKKGILKGVPGETNLATPQPVADQAAAPLHKAGAGQPGVRILSSVPEEKEVDKFEPKVTRREAHIQAPDVWYQGQTPTHTPTPDYTLPIKPTRAWIKHYSPERVRKFLENTAHLG